MPKSVPAFIIFVRAIILKLTGNIHIPLPYPSERSDIVTCTDNIDALENAETFARTRASGSIASRDFAHEISKKDMRSILAMVQQLADNDIPNAAVIIQSVGFGTKSVGGSVKKVFGAKNTLVSGTVKLVATGIKKGRGGHQWYYTTDLENFSNKAYAGSDSKARIIIEGLIPQTKYAFFHTAIMPGGVNIEEGPIFLSVI